MTPRKHSLRVVLNGTSENPHHRWGLTQNPFPQFARAEMDAACLALQKLGGDPIPNTDYIRQTLNGHFTKEFVDLLVSKFVPGEMVRFRVEWEDKR